MELFYTDLSLLTRVPEALGDEGVAVVSRDHARYLGLNNGIPFILGESGEYDVHLNRFFRALPALGGRSELTWKAYALDILSWARYLSECRGPSDSSGNPLGKTIWEADHDDLIEYYKERRIVQGDRADDSGPAAAPVAVSTWNRGIAALDKLYTWAQREGVIRVLPFTYRTAQDLDPICGEPRAREVNTALESGARRWKIRYLSLEQYRIWRMVGLLGRLPDGREDPQCRLRNGVRNALAADMMVHTGTRIEEAGSLLDREIPTRSSLVLSAGQLSVPVNLAPERTKGSKGRTIYVSLKMVDEVDRYRRIERALAVQRATLSGKTPYQAIVDPLLVTYRGAKTFGLYGYRRQIAFSRLKADQVRRIVECHPDGSGRSPGQLFLAEHGRPIHHEAWWKIFTDASARCRKFGYDLYVTPHVLRHTFAVHYLTHRVRQLIGTLDATQLHRDPVRRSYLRVLADPLRQLQLRLGHAHVETTHIYLDCVAEAQALIDDA